MKGRRRSVREHTRGRRIGKSVLGQIGRIERQPRGAQWRALIDRRRGRVDSSTETFDHARICEACKLQASDALDFGLSCSEQAPLTGCQL